MEEKNTLKTCKKNPSHIWMANIDYCPYCNFSPEERVAWMQKEYSDSRKKRDEKKSEAINGIPRSS